MSSQHLAVSQHTVHLVYVMQHTLKRQLIPLTPKMPPLTTRCGQRAMPHEGTAVFTEQFRSQSFFLASACQAHLGALPSPGARARIKQLRFQRGVCIYRQYPLRVDSVRESPPSTSTYHLHLKRAPTYSVPRIRRAACLTATIPRALVCGDYSCSRFHERCTVLPQAWRRFGVD